MVDRAFGDGLEELAPRCHVWAVRSPVNEGAAERIRAAAGGSFSLESGVTLFAPGGGGPEDDCVAILATVEEHHGEHSHDPPLSAVEVHGAEPTAAVRAELDALGFTRVEPAGDGFVASR